MKISTSCNIYERTLQATQAAFASHIEGKPDCPVCLLSDQPLSETARTALQKSAEQLGFGKDGCFSVVLSDAAGTTLDPTSIFQLIEGIDPLVVIATDTTSIQALEFTYNTTVTPLASQHVFGRPTLAFADFEGMLHDPASKQMAWAALKQLKRA